MHGSPPDIASLDGRRVGLWGWRREGRAAWRAIRARLPVLPLTLFCQPGEAEDAARQGDPLLHVCTAVDADALAACEVVVKSPGISPYGDAAQAAAARGTRFIGGTTLWFAGRDDARTLCVTGTKGKSTTTALLAHLLRAAGVRTALAGNIGLPLLELLDAQADAWAIELSSYQTRDVAASGVRPQLAIVTNIFPEHLDWHGSEARYVEDKLALLTAAKPHVAVLNAADPTLAALQLPDSDVRWYGRADGWHLRGDTVFRGDAAVLDTRDLPLPGGHNRGNLCAVLAALEACGHDAAALAVHARGFQPLPHRLQPLGMRDGVRWVNDSISTTPHASIAALELYRGVPVAILVGGHDRGHDWTASAENVRAHPPRAVITMGQNGGRIHEALRDVADRTGFVLREAPDLESAVAAAQAVPGLDGGVLLLSPGAPSFRAYRDYTQRGRHLPRLGGFDPDAITAIPGLGIA